MATTTKIIRRSDGIQLRQTVTNGQVTDTAYLAPDGSWQRGTPQAAPGTTWTQANGDRVDVDASGNPSVQRAPHGVLDRIGQVAPYAIMAGMAYGGAANAFGWPGAMGGAAHGATAAGAGGALAPTIPGSYASTAYAAGQFGVPGATAAGLAAGTGGVAASATTTAAVTEALTKAGVAHSTIQHLLSDPKTYAGLAALIPTMAGAFGGGGDSPFGGDTSGLMDEARKSLELQRHRVEQAQPVYDTLVNMSYGMSPKQYRGAAPAGYTPNPAPEGAYEMRGPQFGRNG